MRGAPACRWSCRAAIRDRQLGSGLVDHRVNVVTQHRLAGAWTARMNAGLVLADNTQMGAVGIKERGTVVTGGGSLVRRLGAIAQIGGELAVAWSQRAILAGSFMGGNVRLRDGWTLDVGIDSAGRLLNRLHQTLSPRVGTSRATPTRLTAIA